MMTPAWLNKNRLMTARQYRSAIEAVGLSQLAAGRFFGVSKNTAQRYASGETEIPVAVALLLRAMIDLEIRLEDV